VAATCSVHAGSGHPSITTCIRTRPATQRGCPASACAVAEILLAYHEDVLGRNPGRQQAVQEPSLRSR